MCILACLTFVQKKEEKYNGNQNRQPVHITGLFLLIYWSTMLLSIFLHVFFPIYWTSNNWFSPSWTFLALGQTFLLLTISMFNMRRAMYFLYLSPHVKCANWYQLACFTCMETEWPSTVNWKVRPVQKKENFKGKKSKPGFKTCVPQWAPLQYTDTEAILVDTNTYFLPQCFSHLLSTCLLNHPMGFLQVHRNRG